VRVLTPTENNRLNELIGFLGITIAILIALALLSYSPHDPSFNVSVDSPDLHAARNWIGPVGAYGADLLFQGFGYAAFLLPVGIFAIGWRWFRSEPLDSPVIKLVGYSMLVLMVPTLLTLWHMPEVRGAIPPGGLLGHLGSAGLRAAFNTVGANVVALAFFFVALFLTTKFSFIETHETIRGPLSKLNVIGPLKERYALWRDEREAMSAKMRACASASSKSRPRAVLRFRNRMSKRWTAAPPSSGKSVKSNPGNPKARTPSFSMRRRNRRRPSQRQKSSKEPQAFAYLLPNCFAWPSATKESKRTS
jgi:hypothetical protein